MKSMSNGNNSAALAYYTLFTLFPVVYLSFSVCGKILGEAQMDEFSVVILEQIFGKIDSVDFVHFVKSTPFLRSNYFLDVISILVLLFSCSSLMNSLRQSLDHIFQYEKTKKNRKEAIKETVLFRITSLGILMAIVTAIFIIAALELIVLTFLERIFDIDSLTIQMLLFILSIGLSFFSNAVILLLIYRFGSKVSFAWSQMRLPILLTSLALTLAQLVLKYYLNEFYVFSDAGLTGSILILLIWIYFCSIIMFTGAYFLKEKHCKLRL